MADAPRYVSNSTLHKDLGTPFIKDVPQERSTKHHDRLEVHPNALLQPLLEKQNNRRLKRRLPIDLKWSRKGLFAGGALILPLERLIIFVLHHQIRPWNVLILIANKLKKIIEASRSHSDAPQSGGLPWTRDRIDSETSTWQHTTLGTDKPPQTLRVSNHQFQQASGRRPTP